MNSVDMCKSVVSVAPMKMKLCQSYFLGDVNCCFRSLIEMASLVGQCGLINVKLMGDMSYDMAF